MDTADAQAEGLLQVIDELGLGGLILDSHGRVLQTNEKAKRYLGWDLQVRQSLDLDQDNHPSHEQLQSALRNALRSASAASPLLGYVIAVPRSTKRPLLLRTVQISSMMPNAVAAVVLLDLEDCPVPNDDLLRQIFGLTPAECRLARQLSCGKELGSIARAFGVSVGTLRMQLKCIFWKTGTRRQAELTALLGHVARLNLP